MRRMNFLLAVMMIFTLALSACSSGGAQETQGPAFTPAAGNTNGNLNANTNSTGDLNGNLNANTDPYPAGMGTATSTSGAMATPLGAALGTPAATAELTSEAQMATETSMATEAMATEAMATAAPLITGTPTATEGAMGGTGTYENGILVSNLLGANIQDAAGNDVGEIDSVILDQTNCSVPYALVRVNGDQLSASSNAVPGVDNANGGAASTEAPGMGGSQGMHGSDGDLALAPLSAFLAEDQTGVLTLPLTLSAQAIEALAKAPKYTEDSLPVWSDASWDSGLSAIWTGFPLPTGAGATDANSNANSNAAGGMTTTGTGAVRIQDITNINAINGNGDDLGDIQDMVVMLNNQPAYVFLAVGGILGVGEKYIPLPCDRVSWQLNEDGSIQSAVVNADQATLESAPTIDQLPSAYDTGWEADYNGYWQTAP